MFDNVDPSIIYHYTEIHRNGLVLREQDNHEFRWIATSVLSLFKFCFTRNTEEWWEKIQKEDMIKCNGQRMIENDNEISYVHNNGWYTK